jgi:CPA2 family monovalent cation:H+ antiporter-2
MVRPESPLVGVSIRAAGIRESYGAMVVGLERAGTRMMSPDSDLPLLAGDVLWVVGEREGLDVLGQPVAR